MVSLRHLARPALVDLAVALEAGRLAPPYSATAVARYVPRDVRDITTSALNDLNGGGLAPAQLAMALRLLADERTASQEAGDRADLVLTVSDSRSPQSRSTAGVVKEMFGSAGR